MIDTNVTGLVALTRALLPKLIERKGQIINLSSVAATYPYKGGAVYAGHQGVRPPILARPSLRPRRHRRPRDLGRAGHGRDRVHDRPHRRRQGRRRDKLYAGMDPMTAEDLADLFWWLANLPPHLNINTIELMPVSQSFAGFTVDREG